MATRFKSSDLQEMIRKIVRQEMKEVVAATINEVLSERYLKGLAESAVASRPRGVSNLAIMGDGPSEEEVPEVLDNNILGVGQENPVFKKVPKDDGVRQFKEGQARNEMLSLFFEGTKPLDADPDYIPDETEQQVFAEATQHQPPLAGLIQAHTPVPGAKPKPKRRSQEDVWRELAGVKNVNKPATSAVSPEDQEKFEELRLKRMRESLEVKPS